MVGGCEFGMFIPDPDFNPFRIPDLGSRIQKQQQKRGVKKFVVKPFFVATNVTKFKIILFLKCWRKKFWASFQRIIELFIQKFVIKPKKYGVGIRDPKKTYSGSRIRIRNTGWWVKNALASPSMTGEMAWSSPEMVNPAPVIAFRNLNTINTLNPLFPATRGVQTTNTSNPLFGPTRGVHFREV
jgi:hypothetical protein